MRCKIRNLCSFIFLCLGFWVDAERRVHDSQPYRSYLSDDCQYTVHKNVLCSRPITFLPPNKKGGEINKHNKTPSTKQQQQQRRRQRHQTSNDQQSHDIRTNIRRLRFQNNKQDRSIISVEKLKFIRKSIHSISYIRLSQAGTKSHLENEKFLHFVQLLHLLSVLDIVRLSINVTEQSAWTTSAPNVCRLL